MWRIVSTIITTLSHCSALTDGRKESVCLEIRSGPVRLESHSREKILTRSMRAPRVSCFPFAACREAGRFAHGPVTWPAPALKRPLSTFGSSHWPRQCKQFRLFSAHGTATPCFIHSDDAELFRWRRGDRNLNRNFIKFVRCKVCSARNSADANEWFLGCKWMNEMLWDAAIDRNGESTNARLQVCQGWGKHGKLYLKRHLVYCKHLPLASTGGAVQCRPLEGRQIFGKTCAGNWQRQGPQSKYWL